MVSETVTNNLRTFSPDVAALLLETESILLSPKEPFTFASGVKSPIYADCRRLISFPQGREHIASYFAQLVEQIGEVDIIAGTASAGIPHAAWLATHTERPMVYVRGKAKDYGTSKRIEGVYQKGDKVIVVEDTISTGGSALSAIEALQAEGLNVLACFSIYSHQFSGVEDKFLKLGVPLLSLSTFADVVGLAEKKSYLSQEDANLVRDWHSQR